MIGVTLWRFAGVFLGVLLFMELAAWVFRSSGPALDPIAALLGATAAGYPLYHRGWARPPWLTFHAPVIVLSVVVAVACGIGVDILQRATGGGAGTAVQSAIAPWLNVTSVFVLQSVGLTLAAISAGYLWLAPKIAKSA